MFEKAARLPIYLRCFRVIDYSKLFFLSLFLIALSFFHFANLAFADTYFNSSEPGCDGSDPTILWCDDFEDGDWIVTDCDTSGGIDNPQNDGWCGWIYYPSDPEGTNFGRCGNRGVAGTNCAAGSGPRNGSSGMMGEHNFSGLQMQDEIYVRYYLKVLDGFVWGHEKGLIFNDKLAGNAGIKFAGQHSHFGTGNLAFLVVAEDYYRYQNQSSSTLYLTGGSWYYLEYRVKLNTPGQANGVYELWADNCGANGTSCTGAGTLRSRHTDVLYRQSGDNARLRSLFFENWGNPASTGETYYDQIVVGTHRIGPMGSTGGGAVCPNGAREGTEECDGADLGGQSCQTLQFDTGTLGCNSNCTFNTSSCQNLADTLSPAAPTGLAIGLAPTPPPTGPFTLSTTDNGSTVSVNASLSGGTGPYNFLIDCGNDGNYNGLLNDQTQTSVSYTCTGVGTGAYSVRGSVWDQGTNATHENTVEVRSN